MSQASDASAQLPRQRINCPACDCATFRADRLLRVWVDGRPTDERFDAVRCDGCGLVYLNPRPAPEALARYYSEDYACYHERRHREVRGADGLIMRCAYGSPAAQPGAAGRLLAALVSLARTPEQAGFGLAWHGEGRLLDFGCGQGTFLRRMHELGWKVEGMDFSPHAAEALKDSGIHVYVGTLPHPELKGRKFDVITMRHSLEHVPTPGSVLEAARELLAPGGRLVIQVPNYAGWDVQQYGDAAVGVDAPRHLLHFEPETLRRILERAGFRVLTVSITCSAAWLAKAAKAAQREGKTLPARLRIKVLRQWWAKKQEREGRGNQILAIAEVARA